MGDQSYGLQFVFALLLLFFGHKTEVYLEICMCEDFYTFSYVSGCCEIALEIFSGFHIDGPTVFDLSIANNITLQVKFRNVDDKNRGVMP